MSKRETTGMSSLVLAVDGGGTRCRVAVRVGGGVVTVETGPANVSTDFDGGVAQVVQGLQALAAKTGLGVDALAQAFAFVGLAGVTGPALAARLRDALPFGLVRIDDDRPAALRGALGRRDGVIAHCGTGSFYGAQIAGAMRFAGGWGHVLGDEASAMWIGKAALRGTLEACDGRATMTALGRHLLAAQGDAAGVVRFAGTARPEDFGALAPLVTEHAAQGDALAVAILSEGGAEIARSLGAIGWTPGCPVCLTGGVGPEYAPYLPDALRADLTTPGGTPLDGALSLAQDLAAEEATA